ncbi:MAG: alpha-amylase family glycosyl hydrolase [Actinomycetota bacterium]|nr:alpha-amylase family glycosyl hydrolase [Actinomycetota bacterium]
MWWEGAVVYQIYPRSFQDSDGDGVGDLPGIAQRLDHLTELGVDALWLSPIYPSPLADFGYDVADFTAVDPAYGALADFDALLAGAHARGLRVLMDLVPCHTSIEHPWFREHPDWYVRAPGDEPPNNWVSAFGGSAWSRDPERGDWYLHSFYPEQPDLDWRNPEVVAAMQGVLRFWLDRGVDGFRLDAIDRLVKDRELRDDPPASVPFALPLDEEYARLEHLYSRNSPEIGDALAAIRAAAGDALLVGEVYLPAAQLAPYLEHLDLAFAFELFHAAWEPRALRAAIEAAARLRRREAPASAWVFSNHDFSRPATRLGAEAARTAAVLLLTLPGTAFVYQGEEIGMVDGPGADPPYDRAGRDGARHPMQWEPGPGGGFSSGPPWLPLVDAERRSVAAQRGEQGSMLALYRSLIALRPRLGEGFRLIDTATPGLLAFERGEHVVALNLGVEPAPLGERGTIEVATRDDALDAAGRLAPQAAAVLRRG